MHKAIHVLEILKWHSDRYKLIISFWDAYWLQTESIHAIILCQVSFIMALMHVLVNPFVVIKIFVNHTICIYEYLTIQCDR